MRSALRLVLHVVAEDLAAEHEREAAGAVERADDQRVEVLVQLLVRVDADAVAPRVSFQSRITRSTSSLLTATRLFVWSSGERSCSSEVSTAVRNESGPIGDGVGAQRQHGGRGGAVERRHHRQPLRVAAQQVHEAQRGHAAAAVGLHEQRQRLLRARLLQDVVQRHDVVVADGAAGGRPVGEEAPGDEASGCASMAAWVFSNSSGRRLHADARATLGHGATLSHAPAQRSNSSAAPARSLMLDRGMQTCDFRCDEVSSGRTPTDVFRQRSGGMRTKAGA